MISTSLLSQQAGLVGVLYAHLSLTQQTLAFRCKYVKSRACEMGQKELSTFCLNKHGHEDGCHLGRCAV